MKATWKQVRHMAIKAARRMASEEARARELPIMRRILNDGKNI